MKIAVIGHKGMLGQDLFKQLLYSGHRVFGLNRPQTDITNPRTLNPQLQILRPGLVINCAAYTAVDRAESESEAAFRVNRDGPRNLAEICNALRVPLIHISTDYVFDGRNKSPYRETARTNPLSVYGQSKWEGEEAVRRGLSEHLIIRTAWLYGSHGNNFVKTIVKLARERECINVVDDQHGSPTWTCDLASALATISERTERDRKGIEWGTYHFSGSGDVTWYGFAQAIISEAARFEKLKISTLLPIPTRDYHTPAPRPLYSVLDCEKISRSFRIKVPPWRAGLHSMIGDLLVSADDSYRPGEIMVSQRQEEVVSGSCYNHGSATAFRSK